MMGKVALVMGAGAGTGRATALAFSRKGARVVGADINEQGVRETLALIEDAGGEGIATVANMAVSDDIQRVMEKCETAFWALHMVSNNAAQAAPNKPVTSLSEQEWDRCMGVTLKGVWLCMKYQLPLIESSGGGAIVNIASVSGIRGEVYQSAYAAAR